MLWLSIDSDTSCSRHQTGSPGPGGSSAAVPLSSPSNVSDFLAAPGDGVATWRSRRAGLSGLNLSTTIASVGLIFVTVVVMLVRCEQPLGAVASVRPNGSDPRTVKLHSILPDRSNQTHTGGGVGGTRGGHSRPPASSWSRHARHRHQSYLTWFESAAQTVVDTQDVAPERRPETPTVRRLSESTTFENDDDGKTAALHDHFAENVLPRKTVSKSGAMCNLPNNCSSTNKNKSQDGVLTGTRLPDLMSANGPRSGRAVPGTGTDFARLHAKDDTNLSVNLSQTSCLNLDSSVIHHICSNKSNIYRDELHASLISFKFCTHLPVKSAMNPADETCSLEEGTTEELCERCFEELFQKDEEAQNMYNMFDDVLSKFDCEDPYSEWNCSHCKLAYKRWVCSTTIPLYHDTTLVDPCSHYSEMAENRCPYLSPHSQFQYAGEPVFLSTGNFRYSSSKELPLRSCHLLCQDRSINPLAESDDVTDAGFGNDCGTSDLCISTANDADYDVVQTTFSELSDVDDVRTYDVSVDRRTDLPEDVSPQDGVWSTLRTLLSSDVSAVTRSETDDEAVARKSIPSRGRQSSVVSSFLLVCCFIFPVFV